MKARSTNLRIVTTSWDDGHRLDLKLARLLKIHNLPATLYIAPRNREWPRSALLTDKEIKELSGGFEIGAHTMTHPVLTGISLEEARSEIESSKDYLEKLVGKSITSFCYPKGKYNQDVQAVVRAAGFTNARTVGRFRNTVSTDKFALGTTIHAYRHYQDLFKVARLSGWNPFSFVRNIDWEYLAKDLFDRFLSAGGVFHIWGHSWEIEKTNDWERLGRVFDYIGGRLGVRYENLSQAVFQYEGLLPENPTRPTSAHS